MKRVLIAWSVLAALVIAGGCGAASKADGPKSPQKVRGPAVAGLFYPQGDQKLGDMIDELLKQAPARPIRNLRGLVCPHAGYEYSGPVAASAYKQLLGRDLSTVIVLAPSHYARFEGAFIPAVEAYQTPLGLIRISPKAAELAKLAPLTSNAKAEVVRPDFWSQSPKELPAFGQEDPDTWEHSLEVQLPLLQRTLKKFELVPITFGDVDPKAVADQLDKFIDDKTFVVASSDLSHYHPYDVAKALDTKCVEAVCQLSPEWVGQQEACGRGPIAALVELARKRGWKAELLDYRNSGDTTGDKSRGVVGYAAIAFYQPTADETKPDDRAGAAFSPSQRKFLLELARKTLTEAVTSGHMPQPGGAGLDNGLKARRACFVTLTKSGELRGCIGSFFPEEPLYQAVMSRAKSAALEDPRFRPVQASELQDVHIEISVLTLPQRLEFTSPEDLMAKLRPGTDGVILQVDHRQATYLPQVWQQLKGKEEFLNNLAEKAGLPASAWRSPQATVLVYQVEAFEEE